MASEASLPLLNKVAIVTGGSRGIGADIALSLAKAGAKVAIVYTSPSSTSLADALVREISQLPHHQSSSSNTPPAAIGIQADLTLPESFPPIISKSLSLSSSSPQEINILVNSAAVQLTLPVSSITPEAFTKTYTLNVLAPTLLVQAALPHLPPGSRVINISSVGARAGFPELSLYCGSKAALEGLTRCLAVELGGQGTTVNAIAVGPVETEMLESVPEKIKERQKEETAVEKRFGRVGEVSEVVVWLAGSGSSWVSGQVVNVSGGWTMY